jgi:hypothetical protein
MIPYFTQLTSSSYSPVSLAQLVGTLYCIFYAGAGVRTLDTPLLPIRLLDQKKKNHIHINLKKKKSYIQPIKYLLWDQICNMNYKFTTLHLFLDICSLIWKWILRLRSCDIRGFYGYTWGFGSPPVTASCNGIMTIKN